MQIIGENILRKGIFWGENFLFSNILITFGPIKTHYSQQ